MSSGNTQGFLFDDTVENTSKSFLQRMFNIDTLILQTRFDRTKPNEQIIEEMSILLNKRNELYEELLKVRSEELHGFVNSLNLHAIQIHPFYPVPTRCKFIVENEEVQDAVDTRPQATANPWQKMLSKFIKKKETSKNKKVKSQLSQLEREHLQMVEARRSFLSQQLLNYSSKNQLSPMDYAERCRIESELASIDSDEKKKK